MILMSVGDNHTDYLFSVFDKIAEVRYDNVDSVHLVFREAEPQSIISI